MYDSTKIDLPVAESILMGTQKVLKYSSLVCLTFQSAAINLTMRMARTQQVLFIPSTAIVIVEVLKLISCLLMVGVVDEGSFRQLLQALQKHVIKNPVDTLKVAVPSLVYLLQNSLLYVGATHLDAATCQVTYELKILTIALFSVVMLNKRLDNYQWIALFTLFIGVALVQIAQFNVSSNSFHEQRPLLGFTTVVIAGFLSSFASVYFEKILKGSDVTVWMRNVQLCVSSIPLGLLSVFVIDSEEVSSKGFFHGYNFLVWVVIVLQVIGGLVVAVVIKYADNILKCFSTSLAIILSCTVSVYAFQFEPSFKFVSGASLVIGSIFLYSKPPPKLYQYLQKIVTYQLKILTIALFSVVMLNKRLDNYQWIALFTLFIGVALVQYAQFNVSSNSFHEQRPLLGFTTVVIAGFLSSFASVYFEKILKGSDVTVWMRNVQLCVSSIPLGLLSVFVIDSEEVSSKGFFHGYNFLVWVVIVLQAIGGLVVAVVIKYADNILKCFSTSLAIILSCTVSVYALQFEPSFKFVSGASLVIGSIFLYSKPPPKLYQYLQKVVIS